MMTYEQVMTCFVPFYIKLLYQESLKYVEQRFKDFRNFHPDLFMHTKTDSCLYSFVQPTRTCPPEIENSPLPLVDYTTNRWHPETVLFERSYNQVPTKYIPPIIIDLTCNRGSVGQSEGLSIPRSSVRFRLKPDNSSSHEFELHRPSNKGTKLLLKVIKAIIIIRTGGTTCI